MARLQPKPPNIEFSPPHVLTGGKPLEGLISVIVNIFFTLFVYQLRHCKYVYDKSDVVQKSFTSNVPVQVLNKPFVVLCQTFYIARACDLCK